MKFSPSSRQIFDHFAFDNWLVKLETVSDKEVQYALSYSKDGLTKANTDEYMVACIAMDGNILTAIAQVGFPIVITLYLLIKFQKSLDVFADKIGDLAGEIKELSAMIRKN